MSIFTSQDIINDPTSIINYSGLTGMEIYQSDIQSKKATYDISNPLDSKPSFKVSYSSDETNVISTIPKNTGNFKTTNFYFFGLIHDNISGVTDSASNSDKSINGEFIIENTLEGKDSSKLYLCFLLKKVNSNPTNDPENGLLSTFLNKIINDNTGSPCFKDSYVSGSKCNSSETINVANNDSIPVQNKGCIAYFDSKKNSTVIVYLNPITYTTGTRKLESYLSNLSKTSGNLFSKYPFNETDIILSGLQNASNDTSKSKTSTDNDNDKIYIDCNPTGEGQENIKTYNLPINSDLMSDLQNSSISKLLNNFVMFGILLLVSYVGIPKLYNYAVCDKLGDEQQYYARTFILFYFVVVISALFIDGSINSDMREIFIGFFFIFLAIITYVLVLDVGTSADFTFNIGTFITFVVKSVIYLFYPKNLAIISIFEAILIVCGIFIKDKDGNRYASTAHGLKLMLWIGLLAIPTIIGLITWIAS